MNQLRLVQKRLAFAALVLDVKYAGRGEKRCAGQLHVIQGANITLTANSAMSGNLVASA